MPKSAKLTKQIGPYSKKAVAHFQNPHNMGEMKNADAVGQVGNIICGDMMQLYLKMGKKKTGQEVIKDVKFQTYGCLAAIATSSAITDLVKGKTIDEAMSLDRKQVADFLGGLPPIKLHCSVLAVDALLEAIHDYLIKHHQPIPSKLQKKHAHIQKEKEGLEAKHREWVKQ